MTGHTKEIRIGKARSRNSPPRAPRTRLIVVSLDGMRPEFYLRPDNLGLKIPTIRNLVSRGASAERVESIYPTTTYPAHATLVTGVRPKEHGIYSHLASRDASLHGRPWHWFASALRVPAIWDAARGSGLKTAAIGWPVSAGAAIDYNVPEIWDPASANPFADLATAARHSTPGVFEELAGALGPALASAGHDRLRGGAAAYFWRRYRPDALLVHLVEYDSAAHDHGPLSPGALAALEHSDAEVAPLWEAARNEGATFILLSDHGFVSVNKEAAPLSALAAEGLFGRNGAAGLKTLRLGAIHGGGSFAVYWLAPPSAEDRRALERAVAAMTACGAVEEVVGQAKLRRLGADPDAELILDAAPGFYFSDRAEGPLVQSTEHGQGNHGHLPSRAGLEAGFVAAGPGIRAGKKLGKISLTRVAPTLVRMLGLPAGSLLSSERPLLLD